MLIHNPPSAPLPWRALPIPPECALHEQIFACRLAIQTYQAFAFKLRWKMRSMRMRSISSGTILLYKSIWMVSLPNMNWSMNSLSRLSKWVRFKPSFSGLHLRCFLVALHKLMLELVEVVHHRICRGERRSVIAIWGHPNENGNNWSQTNKKTYFYKWE